MKRKHAPPEKRPRGSCNGTTAVVEEEEAGSDDDLGDLDKATAFIIDVAAPAHRVAVEQLDLATGAVIGQWPSGRAASRHLQLPENFAGRVCRGLEDSAGGFGWRYADERFGANEEAAEEGEKAENEAEGEDEAEDEGEGELEDEGEDEAEDEDEDEEQLRPLDPATAAALRKRIRSFPKLRMRNSSQYRKNIEVADSAINFSSGSGATARARGRVGGSGAAGCARGRRRGGSAHKCGTSAAQVRHKCGTSVEQVRNKFGTSAAQLRSKCGAQCGSRAERRKMCRAASSGKNTPPKKH